MFSKEKYINYHRVGVYEYFNILIKLKGKIILNKYLNIKCYTMSEAIKERDNFLIENQLIKNIKRGPLLCCI